MLDQLAELIGVDGAFSRATDALAIGGPVVGILIFMSVFALTIVLVKLWQFWSLRVADRRTAREALDLWRAGHGAEALRQASDARNPAAQALARAIRGHQRGTLENRIREEVGRFGNDMVESLSGWLRPLEVIASLAPLLGLFGTVLGMIEAFRQLEAAGARLIRAFCPAASGRHC